MESFTIGQLADAAHVPISTVRFYERNGLLKPDFRTAGNYRGYGGETLQRLRFIRSAKHSGLSLADIRELLNLTASEELPCDNIETLLKNRLQQVRERINEFRSVEERLSKVLASCCKGNGNDLCDEISRLKDGRRCRTRCDC